MTCASCAARVEKKLNRMDGLAATVNYATEKARVTVADGVAVEDLIGTVESTGYTASAPPRAAVNSAPAHADAQPDAGARLRHRLLTSLALTVPVILLAMVPVLQFDYWQWLSLALAASVVTWGAWPFHRAAWANLRHSAATMDTLISVGVLAAFSWSLYALFLGGAGIRGMNMPFTFLWPRGGSGDEIYLEVASGVTLFMLAGRFFEARAKRRSGAALRALLDLGAKDVVVLRNNREIRIALEALDVGDEFVVRPGEKIATECC